jgi:hypothetical protein
MYICPTTTTTTLLVVVLAFLPAVVVVGLGFGLEVNRDTVVFGF